MPNKQFKPISQSMWPYREAPTLWPEGSASGVCTRWMHIYPPRSTAGLYRPHQKNDDTFYYVNAPLKMSQVTHYYLDFSSPDSCRSLCLCAQQRSENPLWQQGEKKTRKKKEKRKRFDNMAHFPWEKKFLLNSHTAPFFSLSSHFVNSFAATWTFLATLGRLLVA